MAETLLVGGEARPLTRHVELEHIEDLTSTFSEVRVQVPLENVDDPWALLRTLREHVTAEGVLTVQSEVAPGALEAKHVEGLLALAGFDPLGHRAGRSRIVYRARPRSRRGAEPLSCTVVVPCKNEVENVDELVRRLPTLGSQTEVIFVDGGSSDGTPERVREIIRQSKRDIKLLHQSNGGGKAAAVFQGFDAAGNDVVMILDADMTVAPEDLPRFFLAIAEGTTGFANGTRFAFKMERGAMRSLNHVGNRMFSRFLSLILGDGITDSLCGTKAMRREDWQRIAQVRPRFGGHDPWGDFDLLFGAAYVGLPITDVPVKYFARVAGESKMRPLQHGWALTQTCLQGLNLVGRQRLRRRIRG
ncbi:MAG: glycosyltransferase family 2 protein [Chloroflexota bacterium]